MIDIKEFLKKFDFKQENERLIGVERERFLTTQKGVLVPRSEEFLKLINDSKWTYELSACQVEDRTVPKEAIEDIRRELLINDKKGCAIASNLGLNLSVIEVAPEDMPLDVYPEPRYLKIINGITEERLKAACRVTGTHIHLGMTDIDSAIRTANHLREYIDYLSDIGDHSKGERLRLYKTMATDWYPPFYRDSQHFFEVATEKGFVNNPRDCWHLIRLGIKGTVELRMFGITGNIEEIIDWISIVRSIIK